MPKVTEVIYGYGHPNVQATHHSTVEFTKDIHLTQNGDCILVVSVDRGLAELSPEFKAALRQAGAKLTVKIEADDIADEFCAEGNPQLSLSDPVEMVLRKSEFASARTLGINASKAAKDLSRGLVEKLKNPNQKAKITLTAENSC